MSCRVLGRKVENLVLNEIIKHASAAGISRLVGTYRSTNRNELVKDHYAKLGFTEVGGNASVTRWELMIDEAKLAGAPVKIVSQGFIAADNLLAS
jgi:predicted enzyme involved in methoxymalonyl-ACP biosynthesis